MSRPSAPWRDWMEDLSCIESPPRVFRRPAGLAALGGESYFVEPYRIRSPHRIEIGSGVSIGPRAFFSVVESHMGVDYEPSLRIGDGVHAGSDAYIHCAGSVEIGAGSGLSARVFIGDSGRDMGDDLTSAVDDLPIEEPAPVRIGERVGLGIGVHVLQGVTIGERAFVGAGSVVTRDVPPYSVAFGNPARVIRRWDRDSGEWRMGG